MKTKIIAKLMTFTIAFAAALGAQAATETVNGLRWEYEMNDGGAVVSAVFYNEKELPRAPEWNGILEVPAVLGGCAVTEIGDKFMPGGHETTLTKVILPDTIIKIGVSAFEGNNALREIVFPKGLRELSYKSFEECALESVVIPEGIEEIPENCFRQCWMLQEVFLPASVKKIRMSSFEECPRLTKIYYAGAKPEIERYAFLNTPNVEFVALQVDSFISAAETFNGYVVDADGAVAGTIQIKAGKPNKKTGLSKLTASVTMLGEKKVSIKGETVDGSTTMNAKDGRVLSIDLAADAMTGSFDGMNIVLFRDIFSSKDKTEKADAEALLEPWLGAMNMVCDGGVFTVTVAKKGKVTVKGTLDGAKVSAKATALIGEDAICIPVAYSKKGVNLAFTLWLPFDGGAVEVVGIDGAVVGKAGTLKAGAVFIIDEYLAADIPGAQTSAKDEIGLSYSLLPDGVSVSVDGRKWLVEDGVKAAKVKYNKKTGLVTVTPGKKGAPVVNPSQLKLSYKAKDGSFKGSFYVYTLIDGKFKKQKATVTGVLIDGIGYGTATIKKIGSWPVTIK